MSLVLSRKTTREVVRERLDSQYAKPEEQAARPGTCGFFTYQALVEGEYLDDKVNFAQRTQAFTTFPRRRHGGGDHVLIGQVSLAAIREEALNRHTEAIWSPYLDRTQAC